MTPDWSTLAGIGRRLFAIALAAFGVEHLVFARAPADLANIPPYTANGWLSACLIGIGLVVAAASLASGAKAVAAARALAGALLLDFLVVHAPRIVAHPASAGFRTFGFEVFAMAATGLVVAGAAPLERAPARLWPWDARWTARAGQVLFAVCLAVFGIQHFMPGVREYVASVIPSWIPAHVFFTYFTGTAFLAAAVSIATGRLARLGSTLLGVMFLSWVVVLHAPRVAHAPHGANEWASLLVALCLGGAGLIVAGSFSPGGRGAEPSG